MAGRSFSAASATTQANHHDHHDRHIGEGGDVGDGAVPLFPPPQSDGTDPVGRVKAAIARLADDVGAIFEPSVIAALTTLRAQLDYLRREADPARRIVVASAAGKRFDGDHKLTDLLYLCHAHKKYGVSCDPVFDMIADRYREICAELGLSVDIDSELSALREEIEAGISKDKLVSRGEYFSAKLMADFLGYDFLDAELWLHFSFDGTIDKERSYEDLERLASGRRIVTPGFYGAMPDGSIRVLTRGGSDVTLTARDIYDPESGSNRLGIYISPERLRYGLLEAATNSVRYTCYIVKEMFKVLGGLFTGSVTSDDVAGPVGTISIIGQAVRAGFEVVLRLGVLISINLGIMNILPIPALDGGRFLFMVIEAVRGKPIPPEKEGMIHMAGLVLLFSLMILLTVMDVRKLF